MEQNIYPLTPQENISGKRGEFEEINARFPSILNNSLEKYSKTFTHFTYIKLKSIFEISCI